MLTLNAVLPSDSNHIALCDKLPKPYPEMMLKMVESLNSSSGKAKNDCFSVLYESASDSKTLFITYLTLYTFYLDNF